MSKPDTWIARWFDEIAAQPEAPGVWRRKAGGFRIRSRVVDPVTGKRHEINHALPDCRRVGEALETLAKERTAVRERLAAGHAADAARAAEVSSMPLFATFSVKLYKRKLDRGKAAGRASRGFIVSTKGSERWNHTLRAHLIPVFGAMAVDKIRRATIEAWLDGIKKADAPRRQRRLGGAQAGYSPGTINSWLRILCAILRAAAEEFEFAPPNLSNLELPTSNPYPAEEPNSVRPEDVPRFLDAMLRLFPQHHAMVFLGFATGLRPSTLRPLRRQGPRADIDWQTGRMLVRRSQTRGEPMESTKTGTEYSVFLPPEAVEVLQEHVARLLRRERHRLERQGKRLDGGPVEKSELLFPTTRGGFVSASCLDKPFKAVAKEIGLTYPVSPRAMRRSFQDVGRAAGLAGIVVRSISGHATEAMQDHYSTVHEAEQRAGLAKIIDIATARTHAA